MDTYFLLHHTRNNHTGKLTTPYITQLIQANQPVLFTKFGDGEYQCMDYYPGENCDGDRYSKELGDALRKAFIDLCEMSAQASSRTILLGKWHTPKEVQFMCNLYYRWQIEAARSPATLTQIPFVNYHLIYSDEQFDTNNHLYKFVQAVQDTSRPKVLVSNASLKRIAGLFHTNTWVEIPPACWFSQYDTILAQVTQLLTQSPDTMLLIAGGLASKVLIAQLAPLFPKASFLDIGSGFDLLGKGYPSRSQKTTYPRMIAYYKNLLPPDWDQ